MKNAIIFLNGDRADVSRIKQYINKDTLLIGADGGANHILKLGLKPDAIIGDFDSFSKKINGAEYIRYPRDKDFTDGELAIKYAIEKGYKEIIVTGLLGTRVDHLLGNILLLLKKDYEGISIKIIEGNQEIYLVRNHAVIQGRKGDTISFIPIDSPVNDLVSTGLQYDLSNYKLSVQGNRGISNVMTANKAEISIKKGVLLVIHKNCNYPTIASKR
jgi:thiamine pyrophosphokinase